MGVYEYFYLYAFSAHHFDRHLSLHPSSEQSLVDSRVTGGPNSYYQYFIIIFVVTVIMIIPIPTTIITTISIIIIIVVVVVVIVIGSHIKSLKEAHYDIRPYLRRYYQFYLPKTAIPF